MGSEIDQIRMVPVTVSWPDVDGSIRWTESGNRTPLYTFEWIAADGEELSTGTSVDKGDCLAVLSIDVRVSRHDADSSFSFPWIQREEKEVATKTVRIEIEAPCAGSLLRIEEAEKRLIRHITQVYLRYVQTDQPVAYIGQGISFSEGMGRPVLVEDERPYNSISSDVQSPNTRALFKRQADQLDEIKVEDCKEVPKEWRGYDYFFYAGHLGDSDDQDHLGDICKKMRPGEGEPGSDLLKREAIYYLVEDGEPVEYGETIGVLCPVEKHASRDNDESGSQGQNEMSPEKQGGRSLRKKAASSKKPTTASGSGPGEEEAADGASLSSAASVFGRQLLDVLSQESPLTTQEIAQSLSDEATASEDVVEAYLRYGINDQVSEVGSGRWVIDQESDSDTKEEDHRPADREREPSASVASPFSQLDEPSPELHTEDSASENVPTAPGLEKPIRDPEHTSDQKREESKASEEKERATPDSSMQEKPTGNESPSTSADRAFIQVLAQSDEPIGLSDLTTRLQKKGYDLSFADVLATFESLSELVEQPHITGWNDKQDAAPTDRFFRLPSEAHHIARSLRTASKLMALLGCSTQALTSSELHHILVRLGQDLSMEDVEEVLQHILHGVATQTDDGKWTVPDDAELGFSKVGTRDAQSSRSPTPHEFIDQVESWLDGSPQAVIPSSWVAERWASAGDGHLSENEARALSGFLGGYGFGIEPDIRFGGNPSDCRHIVLFRDEGDGEENHARFDAARLLLELGAAVASADDEISPDEERRIEQHLEEALYLSRSERARLRAHLERRLNHPPRIGEIRLRARSLPEPDRRRLATFLMTVAGADGSIQPEEIALLRKLYEVFNLDVEDLKQDLRNMAAPLGSDDRDPDALSAITASDTGSERDPDDETPSGNSSTQHSRSSQSVSATQEGSGFKLDTDKVDRIRAETRDVAQVLQQVFDDPKSEEDRSIRRTGLGSEHADLILKLQQRSRWPREQFEALAEERGLMPGFAIEQINAFAFEEVDEPLLEEVDEPLLEGDDHIELNAYALDALKI